MAKQLTAPGCKYSIVARVDTTIYSPDQKWVLDVPAGQTDFIAETNEIIIPPDAMMCRKKCQIAADLARVNLLGRGVGSMATFITRAIEQIVGKGNAQVTYEEGKMTVVLAASVTTAQITEVENLLERLLPKDVVEEVSDAPIGYTRLEFLKGNGAEAYINTGIVKSGEYRAVCEYAGADVMLNSNWFGWTYVVDNVAYRNMFKFFGTVYLGRFNHDSIYGYILPPAYNQQGYIGTARNRLEATETANTVILNGNVVNLHLYSTAEQSNANPKNEPVLLWFPDGVKNYAFSIFNDTAKDIDLLPTLDPAGKPCMFDLVTRQPFYNVAPAGSDFVAGMTTTQAINLANLPFTASGKLTVSLPWEAQWDTGSQKALTTASTNGWTITVQYRDPDVGTENIPISFLESTGTQYIDTGIKLSNESEVQCDYLINQNEIVNAIFGARDDYSLNAYCTFSPNSTGRIAFLYGANGITKFLDYPSVNEKYSSTAHDGILTVNSKSTKQIESEAFVTDYSCFLFAANTKGSHIATYNLQGRIYAFAISRNSRSQLNFIPCLDRTGRPCMFDAVTGKLFYNATTGPDFITGMTWEQVRKLSLPTTGGQLTLSLPYEASIDGIAQAALEQARANGWVLTLQYDEAELPAGYSKLDFLESTGTQYIDTGLSVDNESDVECTFRSMTTAETYVQHEAIFGTRATYSEGITLFAPSSRISTAALIMGTPLDVVDNFDPQLIHSVRANKNELIFDSLSKVNSVGISGTYSPMLLFCVDTNPDETSWRSYYSKARIYTFNISRSNSLQLAYIPCLDPEGVPCMYDLVTRQPFRNNGTGQFIAGMTMAQARNLANLPVPTTSNTLTVSVPKEASLVQYNQEVVTALNTAAEEGWEIAVQYRDAFEDEAIRNKYAACTTIDDFKTVDAAYKSDLTSDGTWVYPIPALSNASHLFNMARSMKAFDIDISHLTNISYMFWKAGLEGKVNLVHPTITSAIKTLGGQDNEGPIYTDVILNLPECTDISGICYQNVRLQRVEGNLDKVTIANEAFFGRHDIASRSLLDFRIPLRALSSGATMFYRQGLTKESVLLILDSIPPYTDGEEHKLYLGIHRDYENDSEILEAIDKAITEKGWMIERGWNGQAGATGTAAAQTYSLRRPPIYAWLEEINGRQELICADWVSHPEKYKVFSSVEEAREYFGLEPEIEQ